LNGKTSKSINYKNNLKDGTSTYYFENGKISKKSNFKLDKIDGVFYTYSKEGLLYDQSNYKNNLKHGTSIVYDYKPDNTQYISEKGNYKNGKKNGLFEYFDYYFNIKTNRYGKKLILTASENYKDGYLHGEWLDYNHEKGFLLIKTNYINGTEHGTRWNYCPHGIDVGKLYNSQEYTFGKGEEGRTFYCDCPWPN